jgi:uroporphyrinogen-III decarboxylase
MGVMNTVYALADAPHEVEHTLEVLAAADDPIYDIIAGSPAPLVYFPDNITGEVVSPSIFTKYYAPYYKRRVPALHAAGQHIFLHIDGTMRPVLPLVAETGIDAAQSLTPAPVGDVPVSKMRALGGPDLIIWGGVPAAFFSPVYPESVLRDIVMECIRCFPRSESFILGVCDQVPPDGIIERVKVVADLVEEYARYE